jgi:hypothetical protein
MPRDVRAIRRTPLTPPTHMLVGLDGLPLTRTPDPGTPLSPSLAPPARPRHLVPWAGYNLSITPRQDARRSLTPFETLRHLADACDPVRICIEDLKGQVRGFTHGWKAKEGVSQSQESAIAAMNQQMRRPDGRNEFNTWLTMALEEILVTDALALYRWRRRNGDPIGMLPIDGTKVKVLVDDLGMTPEPPAPAYQQIVDGVVETEFTTAWGQPDPFDPSGLPKYELSYRPKNVRTWTPYGHSPVERFLLTIQLILNRQLHYLNFYTEGSIPDAFWKLPEGFTPEQVAQAQTIFDELLAGEPGEKSKLRFMLGGPGAGLENPRGQDQWQFQFEEFLWRIAAWAVGVSPLPVVQMMNRATSEQAEQAATDSGTKPMMRFLSAVFTTEAEQFWGYSGIESVWTANKDEDSRLIHDRNRDMIDRAVITVDEWREELGKDALGIDRPFVMTPSGPLVIDAAALDAFSEVPGGTAAGRGAVGTGSAPEGGVDEARRILDAAPSLDDGQRRTGAAGDTLDAAPRLAALDMRRWRKLAMKEIKESGVLRRALRFRSSAIAKATHLAVTEWLAEARSQDDVAWAFHVIAKARRPLLAARRRLRLERRLKRAVADHFRERRGELADLAVRDLEAGKLRKVDDDQVDRIMDWDVFVEAVEDPVKDAYLEGEVAARNVGGVEIEFGLTDEAATEYAQTRGAELVGMRRMKDGSMIPNTSARWSVAQTVREKLKDTIAKALEEGWTQERLRDAIESPSIWESRARTIARTEVAFALNAGTADAYGKAGVEEVDVLDGPGCLADGHDDAVSGVNGERWPLAKSRQYPLGHPNCVRDFAPVV